MFVILHVCCNKRCRHQSRRPTRICFAPEKTETGARQIFILNISKRRQALVCYFAFCFDDSPANGVRQIFILMLYFENIYPETLSGSSAPSMILNAKIMVYCLQEKEKWQYLFCQLIVSLSSAHRGRRENKLRIHPQWVSGCSRSQSFQTRQIKIHTHSNNSHTQNTYSNSSIHVHERSLVGELNFLYQSDVFFIFI